MDFLSTIESSSSFFFLLFFTNFKNLTNYIICKDSPFDSIKDPRNDRRTTTRKKWGRSPLFKVIFFLDSVRFILRFGGVYPQPYSSIICGDLRIQFNHKNIKFKYICRFTFSHRCVIDKLIFS